MQNNICIQLFVLDTVKLEGPEHLNLQQFSNVALDVFPIIVGFQSVSKEGGDYLNILTTDRTVPYSHQREATMISKITAANHLIHAIDQLTKQGFTLGHNSEKQIICWSETYNRIRVKPYKCSRVTEIKMEQSESKQQFKAKSWELLDIWRWGVFAANAIFGCKIEYEINQVLKAEQVKQLESKVTAKYIIPCQQKLVTIVKQALSVVPENRPTIQAIQQVMRIVINFIESKKCAIIIDKLRSQYFLQKESLESASKTGVSQEQLLTEDLRKKISGQLTKLGLKAPVTYKSLFKASQQSFEPENFYIQCTGKGNLVFMIQTEEVGVIFAYIAPKIVFNEQVGIFGCYITDPQSHSFIYSVKNQEFCKIIHRNKAFRVCPGYGPIIGDGDIIIRNSKKGECLFPKSYQSGKKKKITPRQIFSIIDYEVFQAIPAKGR